MSVSSKAPKAALGQPRPLVRVPLVPSTILTANRCAVGGDTRYRAAARLRQSLWREARGLNFSQHRLGDKPDGDLVALGSRLDPAAGRAGANFISPAVHALARREVALCEDGALIETERLTCNLLSSTALVFSLLGPLALHPELSTAVFRLLLPTFVHSVEAIRFETSPGRGDSRYLGDYTAFDAALDVVTPDGEPATVFIEVKYTEGLSGPAASSRPRYDEASREVGLFIDPESSTLRTRAVEQFWRLHMLTGLAVKHGVTPRALFITISPSLNRRVAAAVQLFNAELVAPMPADDAQVGFIPLTLETVVAAIAAAGDDVSAIALTERYLDLRPVLDLVLSQDLGPSGDPPAAPTVALCAPAAVEAAAAERPLALAPRPAEQAGCLSTSQRSSSRSMSRRPGQVTRPRAKASG